MRALLQRVARASVASDGRETGRIGPGLLVYVGVAEGDTAADAARLATKTARLRIFEDHQGKLNLSVLDTGGQVLVVPNFTLQADARKGRRPSFAAAMAAEQAQPLHEAFVRALREEGCRAACGVFGSHMEIDSLADGPINLVVDIPG